MKNIYVLCEWDPIHERLFYLLSWYESKAEAEAEAERREWEQYTSKISDPENKYRILSPDETNHRNFFVTEVSKAE